MAATIEQWEARAEHVAANLKRAGTLGMGRLGVSRLRPGGDA